MKWELLVAAGALVFSVITYIMTRRAELAWRRTEFLCEQAYYLDTDPELTEMIKILEGRHKSATIPALFAADAALEDIERQDYMQKLDKLLNFLWRLCYAYLETRTITQKELEGFGWYFWRIASFPVLLAYCKENGFEEIPTVIDKLDYVAELQEESEQMANKTSDATSESLSGTASSAHQG